MSESGILPEDAGKNYDQERAPGTSIGYALANGDISLAEAKRIAKEVA